MYADILTLSWRLREDNASMMYCAENSASINMSERYFGF